LLWRQIDHGKSLAALAAHAWGNIRCGHKYLVLYHSGGAVALVDRLSVLRTQG
jgi:hypothetical protein